MKIAIAGYGVEGKANYDYWSQDPHNEITIVDQSESIAELPDNVATMLGSRAFEELTGFDMVVRTASLSPHHIKTDAKIWSGTNEFMVKCPAPIIGVTGTKGKGTTSTMIAAILRAAGKTVHLVGNIGISALATLPSIEPSDIVVFEMSSFQLWDIETSPHIAVVLGIEPDHLNVHEDMEDYVAAKGGIRRFQQDGDGCIYHWSNGYADEIAHLSDKGITQRYGVKDDGGVYLFEDAFWQGEQKMCSTDHLRVPGQHNLENATAALTVALHLGVDRDAMVRGLESFEGLPHRLEKVREKDGVIFYNDSFSSAPAATVAAIRSFTQPEIIVVGGIDKGSDFSELVSVVKDTPHLKELVLIGEIRHKLANLLESAGVSAKTTVFDGTTMDEIVAYLDEVSESGDVVLLSPGCASFDMFKDFYDRGDQFREKVQAL